MLNFPTGCSKLCFLVAIKFTEHISELTGFSGVLEEISTGQQAWFATQCFTDSTNMVIFT